MAHPDYPKLTPADFRDNLWLTPWALDVQVGLSRNKKYQVAAIRPTATLVAVRITEHPQDPPANPYLPGPDTQDRRDLTRIAPPVSLSAVDVESNNIWSTLTRFPQLARAIAAALYRQAHTSWQS